MYNKRMTWRFFLTSIIFLFLAVRAGAVSLSMATGAGTLNPGQVFSVSVLADDPAGVTGAVFSVFYPEDILIPDPASMESPFFNNGIWHANTDEAGVIYFTGLLGIDADEPGKKPFFIISFQVSDNAGAGPVTLRLDQSRLCNPAAGWGKDSDGDGVCESWGTPPVLTATLYSETAENNAVMPASETSVILDGFFNPPKLNMNLVTDLCPNDPDKASPGICGCGVADIDTDGDGILDCNDDCPNDPEKVNAGQCGCGFADIDADENGIADCVEAIVSPGPESGARDLPAILEVKPFPGNSNQNGAGILWELAANPDFADPVFKIKTPAGSNRLKIPDLLLSGAATYFWRATYLGAQEGLVSRTVTADFTAGADNMTDTDGNGVSDDCEVGESENRIRDRLADMEAKGIKYVQSDTGEFQFGLLPDATDTIVEAVKWTGADGVGEAAPPEVFPRGVIAFRVQTVAPGNEVGLTIYFDHRLASGQQWWKYVPADGWSDYSGHAVIAKDRLSVHLYLKDGGFGDADGVANGIIVDPSGPAGGESADHSGGCFIDQLTGRR